MLATFTLEACDLVKDPKPKKSNVFVEQEILENDFHHLSLMVGTWPLNRFI